MKSKTVKSGALRALLGASVSIAWIAAPSQGNAQSPFLGDTSETLFVATSGLSTGPRGAGALPFGPPPCAIACMGVSEPDACGTVGTDNGCFGGIYIPIAIDGTPVCGDIAATGGARDVDWFQFTQPSTGTIAITLQSEFPGLLLLGACSSTPGFVTIFAQDNSADCMATPATISGTLSAGTYIVLVTAGDGPLNMGDIFNGYPCSGGSTDYQLTVASSVPPGGCTLTCSGAPESEACGVVANNGCNLSNPGFESIALGSTLCASSWANGGTRDTDWYEFVVPAPLQVSWTISGELPLNSLLLRELGSSGDCDDVQVFSPTVFSDGDCAAVTSPVIALPCGTYYLFVAPGTIGGNAIFGGFPCGGGGNGYSLTLSGNTITTCLDPIVRCDSSCSTGAIEIVIEPQVCSLGYSYSITGPGGAVVESGTEPGVFPACVPITFLAGPFSTAGLYTVNVSGSCCPGGTYATSCSVDVVVYNGESNILWHAIPNNSVEPMGYAGQTNSAARLREALEAPGNDEVVLTIRDLIGFECLTALSAGDTLWVTLGTFPENHVLTPSEGQALFDLAADGVSIYIEGGQAWGFDPATPFADVDGVLGRATDLPGQFAFDGDDSFTRMNGSSHADLDVSAFSAILYSQDNISPLVAGGNDSTDRLNPTGPGFGTNPDLPGSNSGAIWRNADDGLPDPLMAEAAYITGIYYVPASPCQGRVIAQSWEFGGFAGDRTALVAEYLESLKVLVPGPGFRRGNCNNDVSIDIADAVALLTLLFPPGAPPTPACFDACDANDDGVLNIADGIQLLSSLFGSPPVVLPAPSCVCGADPTADGLDCSAYNLLDCP
ncbi:MAG: hypothetical protein AB7O52_19070 [Planctomycetota bacterium]